MGQSLSPFYILYLNDGIFFSKGNIFNQITFFLFCFFLRSFVERLSTSHRFSLLLETLTAYLPCEKSFVCQIWDCFVSFTKVWV